MTSLVLRLFTKLRALDVDFSVLLLQGGPHQCKNTTLVEFEGNNITLETEGGRTQCEAVTSS